MAFCPTASTYVTATDPPLPITSPPSPPPPRTFPPSPPGTPRPSWPVNNLFSPVAPGRPWSAGEHGRFVGITRLPSDDGTGQNSPAGVRLTKLDPRPGINAGHACTVCLGPSPPRLYPIVFDCQAQKGGHAATARFHAVCSQCLPQWIRHQRDGHRACPTCGKPLREDLQACSGRLLEAVDQSGGNRSALKAKIGNFLSDGHRTMLNVSNTELGIPTTGGLPTTSGPPTTSGRPTRPYNGVRGCLECIFCFTCCWIPVTLGYGIYECCRILSDPARRTAGLRQAGAGLRQTAYDCGQCIYPFLVVITTPVWMTLFIIFVICCGIAFACDEIAKIVKRCCPARPPLAGVPTQV